MARPLRYTFILVLAALATALAAFGGWRFARASAPVNGPIVLVSIDSLRADRLPAYGYRSGKTPAIDALAADGILFERAYAHAPQTLPSIVAILTGRLPFDTGVRDDEANVAAGERLLPQILRDRGFTTAGIVSSALLARDATRLPASFDFFDAAFPRGADRRVAADAEAAAEHWLDGARTSRLFLFLHLDDLRRPYPDRGEGVTADYDGQVAEVDDSVGRLVRYLKAHQLYDRSTIVVTADHGEGLGDHVEQEHGLLLYDEMIHVPLIVKQAAGEGAARRIRTLVQHVDLTPTVLDLAKAPSPGGIRGRSLRSLLEGTEQLADRPVYSEALYGHLHFGWSALRSIVDGDDAYIEAPREELYHLKQDPGQRTNVAADAARVRRMRELLKGIAGAYREPPRDDGGTRFTGATANADPKDTVEIVETYRAARELARGRKWMPAIRLLQTIVERDDRIPDVWREIGASALRGDRFDLATDAYTHVSDLDPSRADGYLGAATALYRLRRLDEAQERAAAGVEAADAAHDRRAGADAHELLARIALARRDAASARAEAALAERAERGRPVGLFVDARILFDDEQFGDAAAIFELTLKRLAESRARPIADLHAWAGDAFARLDRVDAAETEYLAELRDFPENARASVALATLYHAAGQADEADRVIAQMIEATPTAETYATAARLWTSFGNARQAAATRAEARRAFGDSR